MLRKHSVAHVLNNWTHMPSVGEQMQMPGVLFTHDEFTAARFLLKPGRTYEQAVQMFSPYNITKEVCAEARQAAAELVRQRRKAARQRHTKPTFVYVNNRLEGSALLSIIALLESLRLELLRKSTDLSKGSSLA